MKVSSPRFDMIGISTSPRRVTQFNDFTVGILFVCLFFFIVLITTCGLQSAEILLLLVTCEY